MLESELAFLLAVLVLELYVTQDIEVLVGSVYAAGNNRGYWSNDTDV